MKQTYEWRRTRTGDAGDGLYIVEKKYSERVIKMLAKKQRKSYD